MGAASEREAEGVDLIFWLLAVFCWKRVMYSFCNGTMLALEGLKSRIETKGVDLTFWLLSYLYSETKLTTALD